MHPKGFGNPDKNEDAGVPPSAFDPPGVREVDLCFEGKLLLGQSSRLASPAHIRSDNSPPISHGRQGTSQGIYSLGTIVLIPLWSEV